MTLAASTFFYLVRIHPRNDPRITAPAPALQRMLDITGADQVLTLHATVADASA
ncbi:hypothetical protein [Streptomyces sp. NPDC008141]|uniref:hypothetical protein n=1 Tax=Streptomyces sp. NPDC008141 TaxID=3364815 RepID=UPI0036EA5E08